MNGHLNKEVKRTANKHMQKSSTFFVIGEFEIKTSEIQPQTNENGQNPKKLTVSNTS